MAAPAIGIRPRYAPRALTTVDASHPLAAGLQFCFVPNVGTIDLARGFPGARVGTSQASLTEFGAGIYTPAGTSRVSFSGLPDAPFTSALTIFWAGAFTGALNTFGYVVGKQPSHTTNTTTPISFYGLGSPRTMELARGNASSYSIWPLSGDFATNKSMRVIVTAGASIADPLDTWVNGVYAQATASVAGTGAVTGNNAALVVGSRATDSLASNNVFNVLALWNRRLNAGEAAMLTADPFCFLRY